MQSQTAYFFLPEYSDHLWSWSSYFGRNSPTEIRRS